ncbi:MAG: phenylacetic acid degradation bifunctional protein PaaZ [Candidatus Fluviicola riflensis]|nr:MAG: phenylacetic acid degradation bifunctional protein PaaZ [Candidatus Fluviicola riflensis]OGS77639.1 MAG: phenylacetic acid degradation bifunctional protein PaaZ [Candidatus Fluviicola riflensis]OGS84222.1 MAG: phenylacetic acid degradation bifunctional protein PaaZ [Fluviicola sp. RIFCSPHIGHO2_12_FULL_43_24]OGS84705.1 MAG: phenylacetic acid degradation bifunctional protein PaaZ [Fluviicola sp. RIFCSPHIGHO2_01_FULL_43_53]
MIEVKNYVCGQWVAGEGTETTIYNAITGDQIGSVSSAGIDFEAVLNYGRKIGGSTLRKMTFQERGRMLKALALFLMEQKNKYYEVSAWTGATKVDSWIDIEGGIGNLFANASLRRQFPDLPYYVDGTAAPLSKSGSFIGHHIMVPKQGVAVHINAFNFPIWGMLEKIAVNLMAGVPAVVKPSEATSFLTEVMVKDIIDSKILPEGALQLVSGFGRGIIDHVTSQDVVTFTGSAHTGKKLKAHPRLIEESVPFNLEADSLNAMVLGMKAAPGTEEFDLFVKEVTKEITVKAGQKCTAVRRIMVPENYLEEVQQAVAARLSSTKIGDPSVEGVRMGSLVSRLQVDRVRASVEQLSESQQMVFGSLDTFDVIGADKDKGAFFSPILFRNDEPFDKQDVHTIEAFGPVSTIMPYKTLDDAIELTKMGKGSLVTSIVTADDKEAREFVVEAACMNGRIMVLNKDCAKESTGHGSPMPLLTHGGPGRAGGGEEMGGKRGVMHYLQRTAIQGHPTTITEITQQYQQGAAGKIDSLHPFKKHFEELNVGDQLITESRLITAEDIDAFAALSGDNFYAHKRETNFAGTMFDEQVAHGYFIMSISAGLFVDSYVINPVLLNYGIDELRFTKPVYTGAKIHIRFTCKEKISSDVTPNEADPKTLIQRGVVKWLVEMLDDTDQPLVGIATILTMVKKLDQN